MIAGPCISPLHIELCVGAARGLAIHWLVTDCGKRWRLLPYKQILKSRAIRVIYLGCKKVQAY